MLPPLKLVRRGLRRTTEALADELARGQPGSRLPAWTDLEWRLATAVAVAHGVSPLLHRRSTWPKPAWRSFLAGQHAQVALRHARIEALLRHIDHGARDVGLPVVPLKGSALHALGLYAPGDRPMADIDLLVRDDDVVPAIALLHELGYEESFAQWKHRVFKPVDGRAFDGLGEHCDTPVNIELHTRIQERLPLSTVDITERIFPRHPIAGLNAYPSNGALMSHLLLHAAGNLCGRSMRLMHLNDVSLLATRMVPGDWDALWNDARAGSAWWAFPPLRLVARYYAHAVPMTVLSRLEAECPPLLRALASRWTLTDVSCSDLWLRALPGIEWSQSISEAGRCVRNRFRPSTENKRERADMVRTQVWLQGQSWVTQGHRRRMLTWLTRPIPRMDTLYVVRAALASNVITSS